MASHVFDSGDFAVGLETAPDAEALDAQAMARMLVARYPAKAFEVCEALSDHNMAIGNGPRAAAWDGVAREAARLMAHRWA